MFPVTPPAIVAPAPSRAEQKQQQIEFRDKLHQQLFHGEIKLRAADGRTYNRIDSDGEYVSSFLSPYNRKILDNVEPGVRSLVSALINRGYLTAASCQGHSDQRTRFVMIAFGSELERQQFVKDVDSFKLPVYWYYNFVNAVDGAKLPETREGITLSINMRDRTYDTIANQRAQGYTLQDLTDFWNIMFARNYSNYWAVKMCICSQPGDCSRWTQFKTLLQWPLRNYWTRKLAAQLKTLPYYQG